MTTPVEDSSRRLNSLYWTEKTVSNPIKWGVFISGSALLSYWSWNGIPLEGAVTLLAYAVQNLVFTVLFARVGLSFRTAKLLVLVSYTFDFVFVAYLIFGLGGTASQVAFLMYVILIFKAGLYYPVFHESLLILPIAILFYLGLLAFTEGFRVFADYSLRPRLFILLGIPAVTIYTARLLELREQDLSKLNARLRAKTVELKRQTRELEAVIEGMRHGLLVIDPALNVVTMNPEAAGILRLPEGTQPPVPLSVSDNGMALRDVVVQALESEEHIGKAEIQLPLPNDGESERRSYQAVASVVPGDNCATTQAVVILRDVTEQMRLEYAKSNFLSVVSHELRTPLSSIKGFLDIILSERPGPLNETQKDFLTTAKGQAEYLHALINDLVEFSRIQVRRAALDVELVSLADLTRSVCARLLPLVQDKSLSLVNQVQKSLPLIEGDQLRLDQVVTNLITNAIKFTPPGGEIVVSAHEEDDEIVYSVRDNGVGIPKDQQEKIFEPFYQVSEGPARLHGGMGLGLAICRHVIERHHGRLFVESAEGQGSTFHFALPKQHPVHQDSDGQRSALQS